MEYLSIEKIINTPSIIPVITIEDEKQAVGLARTLKTGGLNILEVTLRTANAINAAEKIIREIPDIVVGIGTVKVADDIKRACDVGAKFIVSPGLTEELAKTAEDEKIPFLPGCYTPTDVIHAMSFGFTRVKFFPAELAGGINMLRQFAALFPDMKFCPTGGINESNVKDYLQLSNVFCVGGSWLTPIKLVNNNDWQAISKIANDATAIVNSTILK